MKPESSLPCSQKSAPLIISTNLKTYFHPFDTKYWFSKFYDKNIFFVLFQIFRRIFWPVILLWNATTSPTFPRICLLRARNLSRSITCERLLVLVRTILKNHLRLGVLITILLFLCLSISRSPTSSHFLTPRTHFNKLVKWLQSDKLVSHLWLLIPSSVFVFWRLFILLC
jgi:hypothetical protein